MKSVRVTCLLSFFLFNCSDIPEKVEAVLENAGENRMELDAVIKNYQSTEDSLKLKAAYFLIGNMANKTFHTYSESQERFISVLDSMNTSGSIPSHGKLMQFWDSLKLISNSFNSRTIRDHEFVSSELLISNIDRAFDVWKKVPWARYYSFEDFCEYVLPYRNTHYIPNKWRELFEERNNWVLDSSGSKGNLLELCKLLNDSIKWLRWGEMFYEFPQVDILDLKRTKRGCCRQQSSLKIATLRSIGIPVAQVFAAHGTSWVSVLDTDGAKVDYGAFYAPRKGITYEKIRRERYSKVFMQTYEVQPDRFNGKPPLYVPSIFRSTNLKDVTSNHTITSDVNIHLKSNHSPKHSFAFLCVFNEKGKGWDAIDVSPIRGNLIQFKQLGRERIYLPTYFDAYGHHQISDPFFLSKAGETLALNSDEAQFDSVKLYRKSHLNTCEHRFADLMIGGTFEGANKDDFQDAEELHKILELPEYFTIDKINSAGKYRYVRYRSDTIIRISDVAFYTHDSDVPLTGRIIFCQDSTGRENAFDGDIRTNFNTEAGGWVGLDLGKPISISKVGYMFRNSFNTIEPGDHYELFYWKNKWISLGEKTAQDNYLDYRAPKNALLWLRNITKGKSENIFFMKDGKQVWG